MNAPTVRSSSLALATWQTSVAPARLDLAVGLIDVISQPGLQFGQPYEVATRSNGEQSRTGLG